MEKNYDPKDIEQYWYEKWEKAGYFAPDSTAKGKTYAIAIPPPNVTGSLHMGHAFQDTLMDTLIRYHRMSGDETLWQAGMDHAGIATQMVVERQLAKEGLTRHALGRESFIEKIWQWKNESGGTITGQLRRMGASLDWSRERFTMDEGLSKAVQEVFVRLYEEGLIYRGKRLVNWDPKLHTAISDLEVINEEESGHLWHIRYPVLDHQGDGDGYLVVATTRPETMLGDAAVAVHPDDERYQHLIGKQISLPLVERTIPIIADDYVDRDFGTGCVKITPAHDFNDYEVGMRHELPLINVLTVDATLNDEVPTAYRGLDRFEARKKIISDLETAGLMEKIEPHQLKVPRGDRSGVVIEPYLTDQWYVKVGPLAEPAIKAVETGQIEFVPKNWENTYFAWMRDLQDWCISRQLWWGHRIPAWYDEEGNVYVGRDEQEVRETHSLADSVTLTQDEDVLDTWFSSALWTFSTLGWPEETPEFKKFHPTDVLVTGFDIIFFWVARMIMMTLKFTGDIPFKKVYVHGLVRDNDGQKMSKSKGNVLDPIDLIDGIQLEALVQKRTQGLMQPEKAKQIEKATRRAFPTGIESYGTDALRFTFCALASTGRDIKFDMGRIEGYRNFCNKLWNAARFVLMNSEDFRIADNFSVVAHQSKFIADHWIISQLQQVIQAVRSYFDQFRFDHAAQAIYEFIWNQYCDWYLELTKPILYGDQVSDQQKEVTQSILLTVLDQILRLSHPMMPFITEAIWQSLRTPLKLTEDSIMVAAYPVFDGALVNSAVDSDVQWIKEVIIGIRNIRGEMNISPSKKIKVLLHQGSAEDKKAYEKYKVEIENLAKLESLDWLAETETPPPSAMQLAGSMKVFVPMAGLIDVDAELVRLDKALNKTQQEIDRLEAKLSKASFVDKAPEQLVKKEKEKLSAAKEAKENLLQQRKTIAEIK